MYEGVPLYTVLSTGSVASSASAVTRPKSPIFTSSFQLNMMFSGCSGQKRSSISLRPGATSQGLVVSTSPSDPCGWTYRSGCTQLHWLFVWKPRDFPLSCTVFVLDSSDLSISWGFQWNTAPSECKGTWALNPGLIWTVKRSRQSDFG